jgi:hypothetical protein
MLNLDETIETNLAYINQRDLYLRGFLYSFGVITFIDIVRNQVAEINLLQLVPGFYLILLFISFLILVIFSDLLIRIPFEFDNNKSIGTKTINRMEVALALKFSFFLFFSGVIISLNTIIPLGLDAFYSYGEKTLENFWSFDEVINLETILLTVLISLSQIPVIALNSLNTEKDINFLPEFWKTLSLIIFLAAGFITPTIDGYTQLSFAASAVSLYIIVINLLEKRINVKFNTTSVLG